MKFRVYCPYTKKKSLADRVNQSVVRMTQRRILIVEDEEKIASLLRDYLEKIGGYQTHWVARGDEALGVFDEVSPSLVLLDLMLPGMDGLEVCKAIRAKSHVPIIMVTALVEEIDRLNILGARLRDGFDRFGIDAVV